MLLAAAAIVTGIRPLGLAAAALSVVAAVIAYTVAPGRRSTCAGGIDHSLGRLRRDHRLPGASPAAALTVALSQAEIAPTPRRS